MEVKKDEFGLLPDGREVAIYTMKNSNGYAAKVMSYGATLVSLRMPAPNNQTDEITLGFHTLEEYLGSQPYLGATFGRCANRISHGTFSLDGETYKLAQNDGIHHLHGGELGFDKVVWETSSGKKGDTAYVIFRHYSPDGEEGYPGTLSVTVTYALSESNTLSIDYKATTDKKTIINLTNHTYWNLGGEGSGKIDDHILEIYADQYLPVTEELIPEGKIESVEGTKFDFRTPKKIGPLSEAQDGYDHCFLLGTASEVRKAARITDPVSRRGMEIYTDQPGLQLYTANMLDISKGRRGPYGSFDALCVETEALPDAINHQDSFPPVILYPEVTYHTRTEHRFFIDG